MWRYAFIAAALLLACAAQSEQIEEFHLMPMGCCSTVRWAPICADGLLLGSALGTDVGCELGTADGYADGLLLGSALGTDVGCE
ncbi:hypothetical protein B484DRAFT_411047 [Ochromonadaceae sp. CCMP2298]|nr:hypothetical protein B484DRAFT_411047 [Ochromonadaceae sp. CCMP2298]